MTEALNSSISQHERFSIPADLLPCESTQEAPGNLDRYHAGKSVGRKNIKVRPCPTKTADDVIMFHRYENEVVNLALDKTKNYLIVCAGRATSNLMDTAFRFGDVIYVYRDSSLNAISFTGSFSVLEIGDSFQPSIKNSQSGDCEDSVKTDYISFTSRCLAEACKSLWEYDPNEIAEARNMILSMAMIGVVEAQRNRDVSKKTNDSELPKWKLKKLEEFVLANIHRKLSNEELAAKCGYSPFYFSRMLKNSCGKTLHQYVITKRVEHACEMLQNSDASISAISYDCGFSSQSHMTQMFRSLIGDTPKNYRESRLDQHIDHRALEVA